MMQTLTAQKGRGLLPPLTVGEKVQQRTRARRARQARSGLPFCSCGNYIGTGQNASGLCGACANKAPLRFRDLMQFGRLARLHIALSPRDLMRSAALRGYRPTLRTGLPPSVVLNYWDPEEVRTERRECEQREQLANLYDRIMAARGLPFRACRD